MLKGVHLLKMGTFNRFLVLNHVCMDKIKYWWNILSRPNKSMVVISTTNFLTIIKTSVYMFIFLLLRNHIQNLLWWLIDTSEWLTWLPMFILICPFYCIYVVFFSFFLLDTFQLLETLLYVVVEEPKVCRLIDIAISTTLSKWLC